MVNSCWRTCSAADENGKVDGLLWYKDLGKQVYGEFSMAVIQANNLLEDQSQLESGPLSSMYPGPQGTFVGVYDGHAGNEASVFIRNNLFCHFKSIVTEQGEVSENVIKKAYAATDEDFISYVKNYWPSKPQLASVGSCCLVGVLCNEMLYIANAGDSRVVLGRLERATRKARAVQLSSEHNVNQESVRDELRSLHPNDSQIVVMKHNVWRVKGIIQVSRSIGDAYLKRTEFNRDPLQSKFRVPAPFHKPILTSEPTVLTHKLQPEDQFLIFASDGLWEHLDNQEAVEIVHNFPRSGIAKRLIKAALQDAAKEREMRYTDLKRIGPGVRRHFHDDITVIVVFLDGNLSNNIFRSNQSYSIKGGIIPTPSQS